MIKRAQEKIITTINSQFSLYCLIVYLINILQNVSILSYIDFCLHKPTNLSVKQILVYVYIDYFINIRDNIITAMNKNSRGSYDERSATRAPHRNNINIQINFNVKDKNQGFVGKKIDNFVQVQQKNPKVDLQARLTDENKKNKKKETGQKVQKQKYLDTPVKHKNFQRSKATKNYEQKTPQRKSNEKRQQRSKSTNQKLVKRKNAKSMQNIKTGIRYTRNKDASPNSSAEKSRSHSKSSKKLIRNSEQSLKNLYMFTNSGIKNKLNKQKASQSRQRQISTMSKKGIKQQDHDKLKKYMQQKKKKTKIEKTKQLKEQKIKKQKVREQLKRVQAERKANANKPLPFSKKQLAPRQQRLPIYCFDDEEFDQSNQYQSLNKEASDIIHESPPPSNTMNSIPINAVKNKERIDNSSSKKLKKAKKDCLVHKYLNGTINSSQMQQLQRKVIKIQSIWKGYACRRQFLKKLNDQATRFRYIKNKIDNKRGTFWNDEQENSIVNVQRDSGTIKVYDSGQSSINYINFNSNANSELSNNEYKIVSDAKQKTDRFKRLNINIEDDDQIQREISKERSEKQTYDNSKMLKQIEQLRKMLQKQNQKYKSLEEENQNLKANIKVLSLKQSRQISHDKSEDLVNSNDFIQIRMPKKIQSPANANNQSSQKIQTTSNNKNQDNQLKAVQQEKNSALNLFKKQFQTFECSSPSNARLQEQLKQLKNKNIQNIFLKKQIKIDQKYAKKREMFDRMFNEKIVSPRTYNNKKKQLQLKLKDEKEEIKKRIDQAKRVVGFIEEIDLSEQDIRATNMGQHKQSSIKEKILIQPNFKKQKKLQDSCTNTSPLQKKQITFKNNLIKPKKQDRSQSEYSSDSQKIYRKYWTDDIEEVHKHTLQITKKIQQAMKAESQEQSNKVNEEYKEGNEGYNSNQFQSVQSNKDNHSQAQNFSHQKSSSQEVNLQSLKESYQNYLQEVQVLPIQPEKKARQIFNRIDLSEQNQCKSEDELQSSHQNICNLLNQRPLHNSPNNPQKKQVSNLYVSEAEFNKKKKHQQQLSKSSSFQKSNKSLSVNNNSQLQYKGFITNLTFIKQFCISLCEFIRNNDHYRQMFVQNISESIKYDKFEYLRAYRVTISGDVKNNYNNFQDQYVYPYFKYVSQKKIPLTNELFNDFLKSYEEQKSKDLAWNDPSINKHTRQMRQFFLLSIKDNFNESLDYQKPGSIYGEPMPWLHHSKHLKNHVNVTLKNLNNIQKRYSSDSSDYEQQNQEEKRLDQIFGSSIAKIIQWGSCLCGFIADPMPMEMGDSQIANLSDQQLNSIRQNRVGLMLQKWLLQQEQLMTNSTMQYTQVLLFLGEKIIDLLILECAEEVQEILQE